MSAHFSSICTIYPHAECDQHHMRYATRWSTISHKCVLTALLMSSSHMSVLMSSSHMSVLMSSSHMSVLMSSSHVSVLMSSSHMSVLMSASHMCVLMSAMYGARVSAAICSTLAVKTVERQASQWEWFTCDAQQQLTQRMSRQAKPTCCLICSQGQGCRMSQAWQRQLQMVSDGKQ